ncbi:MAG: hypothetical protein HDT28_00445 [Clostridiales bacterium]|nr:hypothetical protein [Clostridiales bacterium]
MSYVDIAIIALVVLCGVIGVLRGVKKSALSLGAFLIAFILAFFLANVVAEAFMGIDGVKNFVVGDGVNGEQFSLAKMIYALMHDSETGAVQWPVWEGEEATYLGIKFYAPIIERLSGINIQVSQAEGFAIYTAFLMFSAMIGVCIFIVARLLLIIVTTIVSSYIGKKKSVASRLCGFLVGVVSGGLWALAITFVFSCMCGLTFIPAFQKIEDEYEHPNKVLCGFVNDAAYGLRNSMFLPSSNMYGRIVSLVYQQQPEEPPAEEVELELKRLWLFVNVSNLNYSTTPWDVDEFNKRTFNENDAVEIKTYADVGFDKVIEAIKEYNKRAAEIVDDRDVEITQSMAEVYNGFVQENSTCIFTCMYNLRVALSTYSQHYADGQGLTADKAIQDQNLLLQTDYSNVKKALDDLFNSYAYVEELFGEFPAFEIAVLVPQTSLQISASSAE